MKLLLTSGGVKNPSIRAELDRLLPRPIAECSALLIPTASYPRARGPEMAWKFITGRAETPMVEFGWQSLGVLELTALPSVARETWVAAVEAADALLVNGGDPLYLAHWIRESGLAGVLPTLPDTVYLGLSAGSMVLTPRIGEDFVDWRPAGGDDRTLGLVDFSIFPHLDHPKLPDNTMAAAEKWAAGLGNAAYAIDDDTAISVVDDEVRVISEGSWRHFPG